MKYDVTFNGPLREHAVDLGYRSLGTKDLEILRKVIDGDVPLECVESLIESIRSDFSFTVPEEIAVTLPCFENENSLAVNVENGALNKYVREVPHVDRHPVTGKVRKVKLVRGLPDEDVVENWVAAGCPGIESDEKKEEKEDKPVTF